MTIEQIRAVIQHKPFQPFVIHLADGRQLTVSSPEFIMAIPTGRTIVVGQPDGLYHIVDLLLVTDLEVRTAPSSGKEGEMMPVG
jgi:hypothetical protein